MTTQQSWRSRWPLAYGAIELKRAYQRNFLRGFMASGILHVVIVLVIRFLMQEPDPTASSRTMKIVAYEEFVIPSTTTQPIGLEANPVIPISEDNAFDPAKAIPASVPKGTQTRRLNLPQRDFTRSLGDLPSAFPGEAEQGLGSDPALPEKQSGIVGGSNGNPLNDVRGGVPVIGRDGDVPSGGGRSGIGSASKPAPAGGLPIVGESFGTPGGQEGGRGFSLQWLQGGTRKKVGGEIPKYPAGSRAEGELIFYALVAPDGSIQTVTPAQKGDPALEAAVLAELRSWKFEPLPRSFPQVEQTCLLTFQFRLK